MTTELTRYEDAGLDTMQLGKVLASSGYFQDARDAAQAIVKVLAGRELGIGPVASMTGIYIVKGRVTLSANLMAAQIKRSGKYSYRVRRMDDTGCEIEFFEGGESIGVSSFGERDAKLAGLLGGDNWKKFPRNMYFSRAMSNGAKWYCPDVFSGPVYTPDELAATPSGYVDATTGEILDEPRKALPEASYEPPPTTLAEIERDEALMRKMGPLPRAEHPPANDKQRNYVAVLQDKLAWTSEQLAVYASEQGIDLVAMTKDQASTFIDGLKKLAEERDAPTNGSSKKPPTREGMIARIRALWLEERQMGRATPTNELTTDLTALSEADLIALGKQTAIRVEKLRAARKAEQDAGELFPEQFPDAAPNGTRGKVVVQDIPL